MKGCKNCSAYGKCEVTYRSSACEELRASYEVHSDPEVVTNADKIRSMTDEELYDFLCSFASRYTDISSPCAFRAKLFYVMGWLKQPAKED